VIDDGDHRELAESLAGEVITPEDAAYDPARRSFNALIDRRPAVIARCLGPDDIATAFDFALAKGLEIAVRGGGHSPAGHCLIDGGLVIDLSRMRSVDVDPDERIASAGGGSTWLDFDSATQAFGLATPGGVVGSTGVTGLTLGGGIGHLTAQHGLTCDNLVGAELVTPDGSVVRTSAHENAELLWGLRGGGGNFGVATRVDFRLHPRNRVVGGRLAYRGADVRNVLRLFRDILAASPSDLSCQASISLDESLEPWLGVLPCYTGDSSDPAELRRLRAAPGLVLDEVGERSFLEQQLLVDVPYGESRHYWKGHFVHDLADELIDDLVQRVVAFSRLGCEILIESLHGAPKAVEPGFSALSYRSAAFNVSVMAAWSEPREDTLHIAWTRETAAAIEPWSLGGGYANYMQADEPIERIRGAFGDDGFDRLQALKRRYDPDNVLRRNQNIPPL
jgi:FAD/FMN-containing dehydrogenase